MSYAIVGFDKVGQALARAFARKNIVVTVASRRPREALAAQARAIGRTVAAKSLRDALGADTIILAVPFGEHREVAKVLPSWNHVGAATLATDPIVDGSSRVVFLSSDDEDASAPVANLTKELGFAPVNPGKFNEGGALVDARARTWGLLVFQDLFKKEQRSIVRRVMGPRRVPSKRPIRSAMRSCKEKGDCDEHRKECRDC